MGDISEALRRLGNGLDSLEHTAEKTEGQVKKDLLMIAASMRGYLAQIAEAAGADDEDESEAG